jgi:hypothetical protein
MIRKNHLEAELLFFLIETASLKLGEEDTMAYFLYPSISDEEDRWYRLDCLLRILDDQGRVLQKDGHYCAKCSSASISIQVMRGESPQDNQRGKLAG